MSDSSKQGREVTLTVSGLGLAGDGVAPIPAGRSVFIQGALPGDVYQVALGPDGTLVSARRTHASEHRVTSYCEWRCGGCELRQAQPQAAAEWKCQAVLTQLRQHQLAAIPAPSLHCGTPLRYRHRVRLHLAHQSLGFLAPASHDITPFSTCAILRPELDAVVQRLRATKNAHQKQLRGELSLVHGDDGRVAGAITIAKGGHHRKAQQQLGEAAIAAAREWVSAGILAAAHVYDGQQLLRGFGDPIVVMKHPSGLPFALEAGVFSQAHWEANQVLVATVAAAVKSAPARGLVLEMHAGAGNLTLGYAPHASQVMCTELEPRAVMLARRNLSPFRQVSMQQSRDDLALSTAVDADVLVLDPPRAGAKAVCEAVAAGALPRLGRVVYTSCDPRSFARDLQVLSSRFRLRELNVLDMFPGTSHIESMAVLDSVASTA